MPKIAFLGLGNIANAIISGLISDSHKIIAFDPIEECRERARDLGVSVTVDNTEAVSQADIVILCVKPDVVLDLLDEISTVSLGKLFISVAAGVTTHNIQSRLSENIAIVRCMPNTPALVKTGMTALFSNPAVTTAQKSLTTEIMSAIGECIWVDNEDALDVVTAISGSGPAYFFLMIESLISAGIEEGLTPEVANQLVLQTALGAAVMAKASEVDPGTLRKQVTSPGGTTQAAIDFFQSAMFNESVIGAVQAAKARSIELSKN